MKVKGQDLEFEWDQGNLNKSRRKHGVTISESESVFLDENSQIAPDKAHSGVEDRLIILGKSELGRNLFVAFTLRREKIRIISARRMHRDEVEKYAEIKKDTQI